MALFDKYHAILGETEPARRTGQVRQVVGLVAECEGLSIPVGALCEIGSSAGRVRCEAVGFREDVSLLMPLSEMEGVRHGDPVVCLATTQRVPVGRALLGRIIDSEGRPVDGGPPAVPDAAAPLFARPPRPLERDLIREPLSTGVRAIDALLTCGKGQRLGLFSGSGVGKSTLLGMMARYTSADVTVVGLVGERGREVRSFVEKDLGPDGLRRSVVVVETSDRPALLRVKAAFAATAVAEFFRDQGNDVLLLMDSVTRACNAQREIGLSAGEPPATKGYPPSVFALLPRLMERAGRAARGSITGLYTVLVEGDDMNEPISDTSRSILDGHVWLARSLAIRGHYPAVDPLTSISRLMVDVADAEHLAAATRVRSALATHKDAEDLINVGAYVKGSNPEIDAAVRAMPAINAFLRQAVTDGAGFEQVKQGLLAVAKEIHA
ncbi:MAG: FliI/YscN family ATPase [Planctomycetes bacterium]|nr:FliI/YscN family ATPase [Planctomycetota bacterium]